jgi:methionine-rich copper-binding protein CopC
LAGGLAVALFGVLAIGAHVVLAHSRPIRFDPPPGAILSTAPAKVDGWFTNELRRDPNWTFLHVTDAQGNRVDAGEVTLSADRRQMSVALRSGLGHGRYQVTWRTYDDLDGAIFGDCYVFFVGQAAADAAYSDKTRLDGGGRSCERIDVEAKEGTPIAGGTPAATAEAGEGEAGDDGQPEEAGEANSGDVPVWGLVLGVVAGVALGGLGARFLGSRL